MAWMFLFWLQGAGFQPVKFADKVWQGGGGGVELLKKGHPGLTRKEIQLVKQKNQFPRHLQIPFLIARP